MCTFIHYYCLDGDGAFLMHMGGAAITGSLQPKNLKHILLNNGVHDSVGSQPTVGFGADIEAIVRGCGYTFYEFSSGIKDLEMKMISLSRRVGSCFLQILLNIDEGDVPGRPKEDLNSLKELFMKNIIRP